VPDHSQDLPDFVSWPTFPFEGDLRIKALEDPVAAEPPRHGEDPATCLACAAPDDAYIWVSERWRVRALDRPTGLPMVLILESRSHLDLGDLPNLLAAELGVITVRLERAVRSLDGVARVHVNRWGDGSAHLHLWFLARPSGRLQLRGTFLSLWDDILPPIPEHQWRENLALIAAWLAEFGGRPLAEPPRIDWRAPGALAAEAGDGSFSTGDVTGAGEAFGRAAGARETRASEVRAADTRVPGSGGPGGHGRLTDEDLSELATEAIGGGSSPTASGPAMGGSLATGPDGGAGSGSSLSRDRRPVDDIADDDEGWEEGV
jgi:hypothetical protein